MNREKELNQLIDATADCIRVISLISEAQDLLFDVVRKYGDYLSQENKETIAAIRESLMDRLHGANVATDEIFQRFDEMLAEGLHKPECLFADIPRNIITYENDKKVLIEFPEGCEYAGYSTWLSKKNLREDPSGDFFRFRFYPDWIFQLYKYEKTPEGRYVPAEKKEVGADIMKTDFECLEAAFHNAVGFTL